MRFWGLIACKPWSCFFELFDAGPVVRHGENARILKPAYGLLMGPVQREREKRAQQEGKRKLTSWWLTDAQPKAKANDPFKIKISNQSEAPCNVQLPFYDPYPLPSFDVKQHEDYVAYVVKPKSRILIRYLNNIYTLRMALSNLGNGRELSELVLEHQGKCCKGFIPNPIVMQRPQHYIRQYF